MNETKNKNQLPKGWKWATIPEVVGKDGVFVDGDWIESKDQDPEGEVRLIQLADIGDGSFRNKSARFLTLKRAKEIKCTFLSEGDILVARMPDPIGRACIFPLKGENKYVTAVDVAIIRADDEIIDRKYLLYSINNPKYRNSIEDLESGTTRKRISRKNLSILEFSLPPLPIQTAIVAKIEELFSEVDKGIEQLKTAQQQLKTYRQAVLKWAFEGKLSASECTELKNERDVKKNPILQSSHPANPDADNGALPEGWRWVKLGDVARKKSIKALPGDYPDTKFIGMDCIEPHTLKPFFLYDFKEFKSAGNYFKANQVLYGRMRPYLNKVYRAEFDGACSGEFIILDCGETFNPDLLKYILHSRGFVSFANNITTGDRPRISYEEISDYDIPLPPLNEQTQIVQAIESRLSVADKMEESITQSLQQAAALRQSILKKAFEGRLCRG